MTLNDKRILILAIHADVGAEPAPSMEAHPEGRMPVEASSNYPWDWADVEVTATYAGIRSEVLLKAQSWPDARAFYASDVYRDAQIAALTSLLVQLDAAAEVRALVGNPPSAPTKAPIRPARPKSTSTPAKAGV